MPEFPGNINLNVGIEQIIDAFDLAPLNLPNTSGYVPGGAQIPQLADTLLPLTVEQALLESFRPDIHCRELYTTPGCRTAHDQCLDALAEKLTGPQTEAERKKLEQLVAFLIDGRQLAALLMQLRQLLQQA